MGTQAGSIEVIAGGTRAGVGSYNGAETARALSGLDDAAEKNGGLKTQLLPATRDPN